MTIPDRYDAFWIPGPDDYDMDDGLHLGYRWLDSVQVTGEKVVVLYARKMVSNRRTLGLADRYHVVSPRGHHIPYTSAGPVLAVWPTAETLELAQQLADGTALCVIPYRHDVTWWITRTGAINLLAPDQEPPKLAPLGSPVTDTLDSILQFGGHNSFVGGGEKEDAVQDLRAMLSDGHRPDPADIEAYARASGETDVEGARRLRGFYEKILDGRQLRDHRGRAI